MPDHPRESDIPVIMLTARVEEQTGSSAWNWVRTIILSNRSRPAKSWRAYEPCSAECARALRPETIIAADVTLDLVRHAATIAGELVELTPTEFELLRRWPPSRAVRSRAWSFWTRSRAKLMKAMSARLTRTSRTAQQDRAGPKSPRYIITVYGVGYKFAEE